MRRCSFDAPQMDKFCAQDLTGQLLWSNLHHRRKQHSSSWPDPLFTSKTSHHLPRPSIFSLLPLLQQPFLFTFVAPSRTLPLAFYQACNCACMFVYDLFTHVYKCVCVRTCIWRILVSLHQRPGHLQAAVGAIKTMNLTPVSCWAVDCMDCLNICMCVAIFF